MAIVTKTAERVVVGEVRVAVCDACGREGPDLDAYSGLAPDGWYVLAIAPVGDRKEACCQACAIKVIASLGRA